MRISVNPYQDESLRFKTKKEGRKGPSFLCIMHYLKCIN